MDYAQLRTLLEPLVTGLKDAGTHTMLPTLCEELGLPAPAADGPPFQGGVVGLAAYELGDHVEPLGLPRHEPRQGAARRTLRQHLQPQLRRPSGPRRAHPPRLSGDSGGGSGDRQADRRSDAVHRLGACHGPVPDHIESL